MAPLIASQSAQPAVAQMRCFFSRSIYHRIVVVRGVLTKNHIAREMFQAIGGRLQEVKLGKIFERGDINVEQSCHCHLCYHLHGIQSSDWGRKTELVAMVTHDGPSGNL